MGKHLILVGAGHAHLTALKSIPRFIASGHEVSVVSADRYHYYSGMGPGMLSGIYRPQDIRFHVAKMVAARGATFVEDRVARVDPKARSIELQSGKRMAYDVISFNTGSYVPVAETILQRESVFTVKPIEKLLQARNRFVDALRQKTLQIVVAGGGPTGVEVSGNLLRLVKDHGGQAHITLVAGRQLLNGFHPKVRRLTRNNLMQRGVEIVEAARVENVDNDCVLLSNGASLASDFAIFAVGVKPSPLFRTAGLPVGPDGGLRVNHKLQSYDFPEIFGGGDCIYFEPQPLAKVGVFAVRQNPILMSNLLAALNNEPLQDFIPQRSFLLAFNMGDGTAIVAWKSWVLNGKLGFMLKDRIDQKFMRTFQVAGERSESN